MSSDHGRGIAIVCDSVDRIEDVLQNDFSPSLTLARGDLLIGMFDRENRNKAIDFIDAAWTGRATIDWELVIDANGPIPLHFAGGVIDDRLLVIGAETRESAIQVIQEMLRINNEQTNSLRTAIKDLQIANDHIARKERESYEELTRLNNRLNLMQRELMRKNYELARLNSEKNYLLGVASHDLRSPLSAIVSYSQYLYDEKKGVLNPEDLSLIQTILTTSEFMLTLITDLLDYSAIESGNLRLRFTPIPLLPFLQRSVELNQTIARGKGITIRHRFTPPLPETVVWDQGKIEQVLNNLLGNAIKFSHRNGTISFEASVDSDRVTLVVEDRGVGIPPESRDRLFTPFNPEGKRGTDGEKSTGLGLAIAKRIVESHGGTIRAEGVDPSGTRMIVTLPAEVEHDHPGDSKEPHLAPSR
ncbi:MAG: hypothetical protein Fur0034_18290 [Desulfuromonadia bacterium]